MGLKEEIFAPDKLYINANTSIYNTGFGRYFIDACYFKNLKNQAINIRNDDRICLISNSFFQLCLAQNQEGGNIYLVGGTNVIYRICGSEFSKNSNNLDGTFSFVSNKENVKCINSLNDSSICNGGMYPYGSSIDYRYYGKQLYASNNFSFNKCYYEKYQFLEDSGYTLTISFCYNSNNTCQTSGNLFEFGKYSIKNSVFSHNVVSDNKEHFYGSYQELSFFRCAIFDNQQNTQFSSTVTMDSCFYDGAKTNVNEVNSSSKFDITLFLLSTADCEAIHPIIFCSKKDSCPSIIDHQMHDYNYFLLLCQSIIAGI